MEVKRQILKRNLEVEQCEQYKDRVYSDEQ